MGRMWVRGWYDRQGRYVLSDTAGRTFKRIEVDTVVELGGHSGGWFVKRIHRGGEARLALVRIGLGLKTSSLTARREYASRKRGLVLEPDTQMYWATSGRTAKQGLFKEAPAEPDPIMGELIRARQTAELVFQEEAIQAVEVNLGGNLCVHSVGIGQCWYDYKTDGSTTTVAGGQRVKKHPTRAHIGCRVSPDRILVTGGTYVIAYVHTRALSGVEVPSIVQVVVTPAAVREVVAEEIRTILAR